MAKGETFNGLPGWAKGVIAVAALGGIGFIGYKLYKGGTDLKKTKEGRIEDKSWNQEADKLNANPATKATLGKAELQAMANQIFVAMDGYGTDFPVIVGAFDRLKNDADFAGLMAAFGIREISSGRLNPEPNYKGPLLGALSSELGANTTITGLAIPIYGLYQIAASDDQKTVINKILTKKKIKFQL